jgi:hypothetical protein
MGPPKEVMPSFRNVSNTSSGDPSRILVQLLMAMKQGEARIVGDKVEF